MQKIPRPTFASQLRRSNATLLARFAPWYEYMLTVTFATGGNIKYVPNETAVHSQIRHLGATLNSKVWKNRGKFNHKCQILYVPVIEAAKSERRIHAHILLANVKSQALVEEHMQKYIQNSRCLAERYELSKVYDADGIACYLSKETGSINPDAVAWGLSRIPKSLTSR